MALSIGVSVGSKIDVGGHVLQVKTLAHPNLIVVTVDDGPEILVTDRERVAILPKVYVQSGVGRTGGANRLAFEAPKDVRISRLEK